MNILTRHIRRDLNLRSKWWHRLILVIYAVLIIVFLRWALISLKTDWNYFDFPMWEMTDFVGNRIGPELTTLRNITKPQERVDELNASSYHLNVPEDVRLFSNDFNSSIYCSSQIENYIEEILLKWNTRYLSLGGGTFVSMDRFRTFLTETRSACLIVDSYSSDKDTFEKIYFLRPDKTLLFGKTLSSDYGFYKVSTFKTAFAVTGDIAIILLSTFVIAYIMSVIYHRVILYIIFGKKNQ